MAATLAREPFDDPEWLFERKLDGIRYVAVVRDRQARLVTRNGIVHPHPEVETAMLSQPSTDFVLDGEMVAFVGRRSGFGLRGDPRARLEYHLFDCLRMDGRDVTSLPLVDRKALLRKRIEWRPPLVLVRQLASDGLRAYERACNQGWEGVIAKRLDSVYEPGRRTKAWLKVKCDASQELVVGGFMAPPHLTQGFKSLLVGVYDADALRYAGKVAGGLSLERRGSLRERLDAIERPTPPFVDKLGLPRKFAHWVSPEIVVQVAFSEWTSAGKLRHPRLLGIREDKAPKDVVREK